MKILVNYIWLSYCNYTYLSGYFFKPNYLKTKPLFNPNLHPRPGNTFYLPNKGTDYSYRSWPAGVGGYIPGDGQHLMGFFRGNRNLRFFYKIKYLQQSEQGDFNDIDLSEFSAYNHSLETPGMSFSGHKDEDGDETKEERKGKDGSAGGGDGISMHDAGTMLSAFGYSHFGKTQLLKWGMKGADWGKAGANYLKFNLKTGKTVGRAGAIIYGFNSYSSFANGNNLQGVSNGLMSMYSFIATKGGVPGMVLTAPFFAIDATIGMDNFLLYYNSYHIDQSNQIQNGNWGVSLWRPGRALR